MVTVVPLMLTTKGSLEVYVNAPVEVDVGGVIWKAESITVLVMGAQEYVGMAWLTWRLKDFVPSL